MTPDPDELPFRRQITYTTRPCLKCQKDFQSEGKHNRICEKCDRQNTKIDNLRVVSDKHQTRKSIGSD